LRHTGTSGAESRSASLGASTVDVELIAYADPAVADCCHRAVRDTLPRGGCDVGRDGLSKQEDHLSSLCDQLRNSRVHFVCERLIGREVPTLAEERPQQVLQRIGFQRTGFALNSRRGDGHQRLVRYVWALLGVVVLLGGLAGMKIAQIRSLIASGRAAEAQGPPPEFVGTTRARKASWQSRLSSVGTIVPARGVTVSNDAAGVVRSIRFESGQQVRQGQVLVELDADVERAQLREAQARLKLAQISAQRSRELLRRNLVAKAQVDNDESALRSAAANTASLQAEIDRKTVHAPFAGKLGIRMINLGQYLNSGSPITILQSTEANFVDFSLPQQQLGQLALGMVVSINDGSPGPRGEARVSAIEPTLDPITRSGKARAALSSMQGQIRPGMFVNVTVIMPHERQVTMVPATAVVHASFGDSVFIVEDRKDDKGAIVAGPDGKPAKVVRQQFVKSGESRGDFVEIVEGIKPEQEVVSQGAFKLRNGAAISINNAINLDPQLAPRPENR
jgi:membrane fusion protein (multidrug efflux system)